MRFAWHMNRDEILELGRHSIDKYDYNMLNRTARQVVENNIVEIGVRYGCSSMLFGNIAKERNARLYSVECDPLPEWDENLKTAGVREYVELINTYSPWLQIDSFPEKIDYLFIDGDHRTMLCIADYVCFMPFVKIGGMIAIHDISNDLCGGNVKRAVDIIFEESKNLKEVCRTEKGLGTVVFRKIKLDITEVLIYGKGHDRRRHRQTTNGIRELFTRRCWG